MATSKAKESCGLGKERKITAPNSITVPNTPTKRTPKSSPRAISNSNNDQKLSSSSSFSSSSAPSLSALSEKHVPNYLKSTASSRHEHGTSLNNKPIKKPTIGPAPIPEGKPSLNRRRSFDKPPPTAPRLDKPFRSPGPRNRATHVPIRSSSFGAKPTTSTIVSSSKPVFLERSASKISKVGGGKQPQQQHHILRSNSCISSSNVVKKNLRRESSSVAASASAYASEEKMVPLKSTRNAAVEHVDHQDHTPSFVLGVNDEELKKIECELDPYLPDPMPELDKQLRIDDDDVDDHQVEKKNVLDKEEADTKDDLIANTYKEMEESPPQPQPQPTHETDISIEADAKSSVQEEENRERNEEEKPERIAVEKEEVVELEESTHNKNEGKNESESESNSVREGFETKEEEAEDGESCKEENHNSTTTTQAGETTEKETEVMAAAEKAVAAAGKTRQGGPGTPTGRKESPAMYNDVIEETASKLLLEKRKNKVRDRKSVV